MNEGAPMNENEKPGKLVVEIPDVVEALANDSEAIGRNAVRLAEKHEERTSDPPQVAPRNG
jgi:hypothetical protein